MTSKPRRPPQRPAQRPSKPRNTVCIAFIHPGECSAYFTTSLIATVLYDRATDGHVVAILNEWSSANVSATRNAVTRIFVDEKPEAEWLLWIDADMAFDHDAMHRLIESADPAERPIVGGLCFGKNADGLFPTLYQVIDRFGTLTTVRVKDYPVDTLYKVSATGAAFLLIHRTVLERMRDRKFNETFPWFQETELSGMPCGEDITFCLRAQMLEIPVHVDTKVKIGHHKSHLLTEDLFQTEQREAGG